jgi:hypothetical protein
MSAGKRKGGIALLSHCLSDGDGCGRSVLDFGPSPLLFFLLIFNLKTVRRRDIKICSAILKCSGAKSFARRIHVGDQDHF